MHPSDIIRDPIHNKDTAFTHAERVEHQLVGRLPFRVETLDQQVARCETQFGKLQTQIEKWLYLSRIQATNETLYYALVTKNIFEMLPIVYTPTVGTACATYSEIWQGAPRGLYLNRDNLGQIKDILAQWPHEPRIIVATDGTRILGLGDLGTGGHQITVGKLSLYTLGGGFAPEHTLPVSFDFGCSKPEIQNNPHYFGRPEARIKDDIYHQLIGEFIEAVKFRWPRCVFQFEDFSNDTAFTFLERHRHQDLAVFNDDIQGTGCIAAASVAAALRACSLKMERPVTAGEQRWVMLGAGAGGIGVAERIALLSEAEGISPEEARKQFYIIDSRGLVTSDRKDFKNGLMAAHKLPWVRHDMKNEGLKTLLDVVRAVKPTGLLGLSTIAKSFNKEVLEALCEGCEQPPIVLALSNPTIKCECTAQECMDLTHGRAYYASGSPMPVSTKPDGTTVKTSQCNNFYVFPAIGMGSYVCAASEITDSMITAVSTALAGMVTDEEILRGELLPSIARIREISVHCAVSLIRQAEKEGKNREPMPQDDAELVELVKSNMWMPHY
eukprot:gnl/Dysnectes_brevis/695_a767_5586.p1 GENE.gnl/Dysnectes_brevis/695_a767_5586~~gnl/Dysnectes_brevis/695_a767_5586.p1  ORF type:complete len:565 (+),score=268.10 gnl/Dysnectes_brevis/695_a767_5586:32-1696(+)